MSEHYIGQILMFAGNYAPEGWTLCNGALLQISEFDVLFNLIGTTYGGDGQTTFAVPDLRSRVPVHQGPGHALGTEGGEEQVTLTTAQLPNHTHLVATTGAAGTTNTPSSSVIFADQSSGTNVNIYSVPVSTNQTQLGNSIGSQGSNVPHSNIQPYQALNYCIATVGIYPSSN